MKAVIIPTLNEASSIQETINQIPKGFDVFVVDGGSSDATTDIATSTGAIVLARKEKTYGRCVLQGLKHAADYGYDLAIVMDAESHTFSDILPYLKGNWEVLAGKRSQEKKSLIRRLISKAGRFIATVMLGASITDPTNGFRAYKRDVIEKYLAEYEEADIPSYAFNFALAMSETTSESNVVEFPMTYTAGKTGMNAREFCKAALWIWRHLI